MLDIHSHFLPKMDDGSKSTEMSMQMLQASRRQGVTTIVSTSHFYGDSESPERFLNRRRHAAEKLLPLLGPDDPQIMFGAEVLYYHGISNSDSMRQLAIQGTDLILIEMPFVAWSDRIFDELVALQYNYRLQIILAHVERYHAIQKRDIYQRMFEQPFYFQCNAEAFGSFRSRRLAFSMMDKGLLHFLGTDCHNIDSRPPNMEEAQKTIEKKLSPAAWEDFVQSSESLFNSHKTESPPV